MIVCNLAADQPQAEAEWARLRTSLEDKVADAQALNNSLQSEIGRMKAQHQDRENDLQSQIDLMARKSNDDGEWRARYNDIQQESNGLKREKQDLQDALKEQQRSSATVRKELEGFVSEMKSIQERNEKGYQREDRLAQQVSILEADLKLWKNRCAKMKTQIRTAQTGSAMFTQPDAIRDTFVRTDGLIQHVHVTSFQLAIDETLRGARGGDVSVLQETLKTVVTAVLDICQDVPDSVALEAKKQRGKVSAMANNFITATKNFMASKGLSPVSLLDAAASNLSIAVVDLVSMVKMKPSMEGDADLDGIPEEADDDLDMIIPEPGKPSQYYSTNGRSSVSESVYSTTTGMRASERFQTLPMSTYQDPRGSRAPSTSGVANGLSKVAHRPQLSAASQSSYNSQPPPRAEHPGFSGRPSFGAMSADSSRQPSFNATTQPAPLSLSNVSSTTTATSNSLAPPVPEDTVAANTVDMTKVLNLAADLEQQYSELNTRINTLLSSIQKNQAPAAVRDHASDVMDSTFTLIENTKRVINDADVDGSLKSAIGSNMESVEAAQIQFGVAYENASAVIDSGKEESPAWQEKARKLPGHAFPLSRAVKDLAAQVRSFAETGDDFS